MTFETNMTTYSFNKETMELLIAEGSSNDEIYEMMESVGFSQQLTEFLMTVKPTVYNSIMIRLKLYAKMGKSFDSIKNSFNTFPSSIHLVKHLYGETSVEQTSVKQATVKQTTVKQATVEKEEAPVQNATSMLEEDVVDSDADSVDSVESSESTEKGDPFDMFFEQCIKKEEGGKIKTKEGFEFFLKWYNEHFGDSDEPDKKEFKDYLTQRIGKKWNDYVLVH